MPPAQQDDIVAPPSFDDVDEAGDGAPTDVDVEQDAVEEPTNEEGEPGTDEHRADEPGTDEERHGG